MDEYQILWGPILIFGSALLGWGLLHAMVGKHQQRRQKMRSGFRRMKSPGQRARDRLRQAAPGAAPVKAARALPRRRTVR